MLSPELPNTLDELQQRIAEVRRINALDSPEPLIRSIGRQLFLIGQAFNETAIALLVDGVRKGQISKRAAATDQLQMHPNTSTVGCNGLKKNMRKRREPRQKKQS